MAYTGVNWKNDPDHSSPINAENLEIMDNGIISVDRENADIKTALITEPIIPITWEQGRLATDTGGLVATNYAIRSKNFIPVDDKHRKISVLFGNYEVPTGSSGLSCYIYEYSSTNPASLITYTAYIGRNGNVVHTFAQNTVAFKVVMNYLSTDTYLITPDKGYLVNILWTDDGLPKVLDNISASVDEVRNIIKNEPVIQSTWEQGRLSTTGGLVASDYAIRNKDFISVDNNHKKISVLFGDYAVPSGSSGLSCIIYEYNNINPVTLETYTTYVSRNGNFIHTLAQNTVAFKIVLYYNPLNTYPLTPDKSYLITIMWGNDGLTKEINDIVLSVNDINENLSKTLIVEPIIPVVWEQGRLSTTGGLVATNYAIRSKNFISIDSKRRGISIMFGNYSLPVGSTGLACIVYEYSNTDPYTLVTSQEYIARNGNITHNFAQNTVAFKITLRYLSSETYLITPSEGYLINPLWANDGMSKAVVDLYDWEYGKYRYLVWELGRLNTHGEETSALPPKIRTKYINIHGIKKLLINAPVNTLLNYYWYGIDKSFISYNGYSLTGIRESNRTIFDVPENAYYLRIVVGKSDNSTIAISYGEDVSLYDFDAVNNGEIITNPPMLTIIDDDSYRGFYTDLYPVMAGKKVPVASAIIVGNVGGNGYMTWNEITECNQNGMEILSHSYSHYMPSENDPTLEEISLDYRKAKHVMATHGIYSPDLLVFPGSSGITEKYIKAGKQNYSGGFTAGSNTTNYKGLYPYAIRRYRVGNNSDYMIDIDVLKDLIDTLESGWMVWMVHTSSHSWVSGTGEGSSAYVLGQAVDYALSKGIPIVTAECGFRTYSSEWNSTQAPEY